MASGKVEVTETILVSTGEETVVTEAMVVISTTEIEKIKLRKRGCPSNVKSPKKLNNSWLTLEGQRQRK